MAEQCKQTFLRQCWYVLALSEELDEKSWLSRRVLDEPILLLRDEQNLLQAITDRCPHRFVPLSMGTIANGRVRCGYHGLEFDGSGSCIHNPHGPATSALNVRSYPVTQMGPLIWIWMGDPALAQRTPIPDYVCISDTGYMTRSGYIHGAANYQLMADNILDLSHIEFLHPGLGSEAVSRASVKVESQGDHVVTTRLMTDEYLPDGLAKVYQTGGARVSREMRVFWQAPSLMELRITVEPVEGPDRTARGAFTLHLLTPETENSTHYFFVAGMDGAIFAPAIIDAFRVALDRGFKNEDKPMIDAQQAMIGYDHDIMDLNPALFGIDKAPMLARRKLKQLIQSESGQTLALTTNDNP